MHVITVPSLRFAVVHDLFLPSLLDVGCACVKGTHGKIAYTTISRFTAKYPLRKKNGNKPGSKNLDVSDNTLIYKKETVPSVPVAYKNDILHLL